MKPGDPRPWWFHLLGGLLLGALCFAVYGLSTLATWTLGETWGPIGFISVMVLVWATWMWAADRRRRVRR